jgi:hypothetical protein
MNIYTYRAKGSQKKSYTDKCIPSINGAKPMSKKFTFVRIPFSFVVLPTIKISNFLKLLYNTTNDNNLLCEI